MIRITGLTPDPFDQRDYVYECDLRDTVPASVDLRTYTGEIEQQGQTGSCTANAMCSAGEMFLQSANQFIDLARLFNYKTSRKALPQEFQDSDQGSTAREALRAAKNYGIPSETTWPYVESSWNAEPSDAAYAEAKQRTVGAYYRIQHEFNLDLQNYNIAVEMHQRLKHALASGYPVLVGLYIGHALRDIGDKVYPPTGPNNEMWGGHEMLIVGYNADGYIVENSWGRDWGVNGYFICSEGAITVDVVDLWVVKGFAGIETCGPNLVVPYVETDPHRATIIRLYRACLGRVPDEGGLVYWANNLKSGMPLTQIASSFMSSPEFQSKYGAVSDEQFISLLYENVLHRAPDELGKQHWQMRMNPPPKADRVEVLLGFSESDENKR